MDCTEPTRGPGLIIVSLSGGAGDHRTGLEENLVMIGAAQRYRYLLADLLLARAQAGDGLSQPDEADRAAELDLCWQAMSELERAALEQSLADGPLPDAPEILTTEDCVVTEGAVWAPRKAA
jgi:hypothetical protein